MMSKGAVVAAGSVGLTGLVITGAYSLGAFNGSSSDVVAPVSLTIHKTVRDIITKNPTDDLKCLNNSLLEVDALIRNNLFASTPLEKAQEIKNNQSLDTNFLTPTKDHDQINDCLVVHWDKKEGQNKGHGNFRGLWVFVNGDKAIVMFNSLETSTIEAELNAFGGVYFVNKNKTNNGVVDKYKKWAPSSTISPSNFESKFPKAGNVIPEREKFGANKDYGGFVSSGEDLNNICLSSKSCQESQLTSQKQFRGKGSGQRNTGDHKPTDWVKSDSGFAQAYSDISNFKALLDVAFNGMKGKWIKQSLSV